MIAATLNLNKFGSTSLSSSGSNEYNKAFGNSLDTDKADSESPYVALQDETIILNADPKASGYTFGGWYTTKNCKKGTEYNWNSPVTKNITLYAKWTEEKIKTVDMLRLYNGEEHKNGEII